MNGTEVERASFLRRFFAFTIDLIILGFADALLSWLDDGDSAVLGIIRWLIPAIYFSWPYSTNGQTVGKRILGIKVVSIDGSPLNWRKGILRNFGYTLSSIPLLLGFGWAIWDKDKQAGHDKIAGTCVVPDYVASEQLQGLSEPQEVRRRQRRWLLGLGAPTLIFVAGLFVLFWTGLPEVREMEPWPGPEVSPEELVAVDLAHLGLEAGPLQNARDEETWARGGYEQGAVAAYASRTKSVVTVSVLRYATTWSAGNDFGSVQALAEGGCGFYAWVNIGNSGLIHCRSADAFEKILWNDVWIVHILALEGTEMAPDMLVDHVRDALAAQWRSSAKP